MPIPSPMITVTRGRFGSTSAQVLEQVRAAGLSTRDEVVARSGLSVATVGRAVTALVEAGVLRERPDRIRSGAVGRPGVPVEIDPERYVVAGVHLGRRIATVALADLAGRVVAHETVRRSAGAPPDLPALSQVAASLLGSLPHRAPLSAGIVAPWLELGLDPAAHGRELADLTGLEVHTGDHIAAVAASEFLHRRHGTPGVTLYVYARDTIGFALAVAKGGMVEVSRVGSLTHFPTASPRACRCGRTGCLQVAAGDEAVVRAARAARKVSGTDIGSVYEAAEDPRVLGLLRDRARMLGTAAGVVRDMTAPDRVVLVGQAFTGCPPVLEDVLTSFKAGALTDVPVSFTRFGSGIQAIAASTVALAPVYDDPMGAVPRSASALERAQR
ncbi:MAG: ROK family protein [Nocardioidaceae bacterium]|nr:ROK family protein [Nocardioidaceae bacterium]